jgi:hypothetical protein
MKEIKKLINPLSVLLAIQLVVALWWIISPGPEGWGILAGLEVIFFIMIPTFFINLGVYESNLSIDKKLAIQWAVAVLEVLGLAIWRH